MLYAIIATDVANSLDARLAARPAHLERLTQLKDAGRIVLAGPHPVIDSNDPGVAGFSGSLIVAQFDSLSAAQAWADADPYVAAGVYANVIVKPFKQVLP
ncbi:YciI family protein [Pseudomonas versuta]|uniref:YciI family protein n=1 Tax=Pseudomonas versuta TaxID=1788301 RepID=UPI0037C4FF80